jgi:hypothetical protein
MKKTINLCATAGLQAVYVPFFYTALLNKPGGNRRLVEARVILLVALILLS